MRAASLTLICIMVLLGSCKQRRADSRQNEDFTMDIKSNADPVLVLVGGNASCANGTFNLSAPLGHIASRGTEGMSMDEEFRILVASFEESRLVSGKISPVDWVKTCFRGVRDGRSIVFKGRNDIRESMTSVSDVEAGAEVPEEKYAAWFAPIVDKIVAVADAGGAKRSVLLIGHSFGGWLAMQLVMRLPQGRVRGLVTIDPISRKYCTPDIYATAAENYRGQVSELDAEKTDRAQIESIALKNAAAGCREFPKDVDPNKIVNHIGMDAWFNFYQAKDILLHSGPANLSRNFLSDQFIESSASTNRASITAPNHVKAARDDRLWNELRKLFFERTGLRAAYNDIAWKQMQTRNKSTEDDKRSMMALTGENPENGVNLDDALMFVDQ